MPGEARHLRPTSFRDTEGGERGAAITDDRRDGAVRLDIVQDRRALERSDDGRKRRPDPGNPALAFERLEQRRFLAALVRPRAGVGVQVEIEAGALNVLAEPTLLVRLRD